MSTKLERGSVVTDNTFQFMKPSVEGNSKIEFSSVGYHYSQYVKNGGYARNESYWAHYMKMIQSLIAMKRQ